MLVVNACPPRTLVLRDGRRTQCVAWSVTGERLDQIRFKSGEDQRISGEVANRLGVESHSAVRKLQHGTQVRVSRIVQINLSGFFFFYRFQRACWKIRPRTSDNAVRNGFFSDKRCSHRSSSGFRFKREIKQIKRKNVNVITYRRFRKGGGHSPPPYIKMLYTCINEGIGVRHRNLQISFDRSTENVDKSFLSLWVHNVVWCLCNFCDCITIVVILWNVVAVFPQTTISTYGNTCMQVRKCTTLLFLCSPPSNKK